MWVLSMVAAHAAGPPLVQVEWRKEQAHASVVAPDGEKIGLDAPGNLSLAWGTHTAELGGDGAQLSRGLELGDLRGAALQGTLQVALCDLAGTTCRPTSWVVSGNVPSAKKGTVTLLVAEPSPEAHPSPFGAAAEGADGAFTRAKESGKLVLLDFSAVWCPPCNVLADEVLHEDLPELEGFEIAVLDVDHPSSFALKERYAVGGYPTVVVVDADGNEKSRTVGYEDAETFLAWLASTPQSTDGADLAKAPEQVEPARAAALARRKLDEREMDAAALWLARAESSAEVVASSVDLHYARLGLKEEVADLEWLLQHAPEKAADYVGMAAGLAEKHPEQARKALDLALRNAKGLELAGVLSYGAALAGEDTPEARSWQAAAVSVVRSALDGEPEHDKGYISWLAHLLDESGDTEGAVQLLQDAVAQWPAEPTFDLSLAPLLLEHERLDEALASAERAVSLSWGDNRLRAVATQAQVLVAAGRAAEAADLVRAALAAQPAPPEAQVRTHRYRARLEAFLAPPTAAKTD
jgi:thioredoxin-like negative regulator of GroEL